MLESIFSSKNKEKIFFYLIARKEGYPREIAKYYQSSLSPIQNQLDKLEINGILASKTIGKTRVYYFNTRYPFYTELISFLNKAIQFLTDEEKEKLFMFRKRPRRKGKPL